MTVTIFDSPGDKPYKCSQCDKSFVSNAELHHHLPVHTEERAYKCQYCGAAYKNSSTLTHHKRTVHVNPSLAPCPYPVCHYVGKSDKLLKSHIRYAHIEYKAIPCELCGKSFSTRSHLYDHKRRRHGPKTPAGYQCTAEECGRVFKSRTTAEKHFRKMHMPQGSLMYPCTKCTWSFPVEEELKQHVKDVHDTGQHYYCPKCYFVTPFGGTIRDHMVTHFHREQEETLAGGGDRSEESGDCVSAADDVVQYEIVADQLQPDPEYEQVDTQVRAMLVYEGVADRGGRTGREHEEVGKMIDSHLRMDCS